MRKDAVTFSGSTLKHACFNVCEPVGPVAAGGANKTGDVMLIQAMFQFLVKAPGQGPQFIGLDSLREVPEPTGTFDATTARAIRHYQRKYAGWLLKYGVDGVIHPASYKDRAIKGPFPLMTITLLHNHVGDASLMATGDNDYTVTLPRMFPKLLPWIKDNC